MSVTKSCMLAATKAVAFAEDAHFDARLEYLCNAISLDEYAAVVSAVAQVRVIAESGMPARESP